LWANPRRRKEKRKKQSRQTSRATVVRSAHGRNWERCIDNREWKMSVTVLVTGRLWNFSQGTCVYHEMASFLTPKFIFTWRLPYQPLIRDQINLFLMDLLNTFLTRRSIKSRNKRSTQSATARIKQKFSKHALPRQRTESIFEHAR